MKTTLNLFLNFLKTFNTKTSVKIFSAEDENAHDLGKNYSSRYAISMQNLPLTELITYNETKNVLVIGNRFLPEKDILCQNRICNGRAVNSPPKDTIITVGALITFLEQFPKNTQVLTLSVCHDWSEQGAEFDIWEVDVGVHHNNPKRRYYKYLKNTKTLLIGQLTEESRRFVLIMCPQAREFDEFLTEDPYP